MRKLIKNKKEDVKSNLIHSKEVIKKVVFYVFKFMIVLKFGETQFS